MQFFYVYQAEDAEQRLVAEFIGAYANEGIKTIPVSQHSDIEMRVRNFLGVPPGDTVTTLPFVVKLGDGNNTRTILTVEEREDWLRMMMENAQEVMPAEGLMEFCRSCVSQVFIQHPKSCTFSILQLALGSVPATTGAPLSPAVPTAIVGQSSPPATPDKDSDEMQMWDTHANNVSNRRETKASKLNRISVTEAMQDGRDREKRIGSTTNLTRPL